MIYYIIFLISVFLFYHASKNRNVILLLLSIFIPCLLAGLRDVKIGIDVTWYVTPYFELSEKHSLDYIVRMQDAGTIELGYVAFVWLVTNLFHDIGILLFLIELIILCPMYIVFYHTGSPRRSSIYLLVYLLIFYNMQLCVIRQFMGISLFVLALYFYEKKSYALAILLAIIGGLFHNSTWVLSAVSSFFIFLNKEFTNKKVVTYTFLIFLLIFVMSRTLYANIDVITGNEKYLDRLNDSLEGADKGGMLTSTFMLLLSTIPLTYFYNRKIVSPVLGLFPLFGAILQLFFTGTYFSRLVPLFSNFLPLSLFYVKLDKKYIKFFDFSMVIVFTVYWYVSFILRNSWSTYPYVFR